MSHAVITVDGTRLLDEVLTQWQPAPPEALREMLDPKTKPAPWMKAAMVALADATMTNQPIRIDVITRATDWTLKVTYP